MTFVDETSRSGGTAPFDQPSSASPVRGGPRWQRRRIRTLGPVVALLIPGLLGAVAWLSLRLFDTASSGAVGLIGGTMAAPGLLAVGAPFADRGLYPAAVAASAVIWILVGVIAAQRATRHPLPTWGDFWRHYLTLLVGVWVGVGATLAIVTARLGESLF